eukprot:1634888-Pleurochrysis_carterae.AAC.1
MYGKPRHTQTEPKLSTHYKHTYRPRISRCTHAARGSNAATRRTRTTATPRRASTSPSETRMRI